MANLDYGNIKTDEMLNSLERRLKREYQQAAKETEKKLQKYLDGFEKRDAEKLELVKAGKLSQKDYEQWRVGQIATGKRWTAMRDTLSADMSHTNEIAAGIINGKMPDVYALNMNYGTFEVEKASQLDTSFTLYNREAVNKLAKEDKDLLPKASINHAKDIRYNRQQFQSHMIQGLLQGESIPNIARRLPRAVGETNLNGAIRRARTMTTGVENGGRLDAYKRAQDLGIEGQMEWIATLDDRTRHSHAILDGERVNVGETFSNGLEYAGDPSGDPEEVYNCRCRTQFVLKGFEDDVSDLTQRYSYIGDMSYDEWQEEHKQALTKGSAYNSKTIDKQYRNVVPMNEYDYWKNEKNVQQRYDDIKRLSGFDDKETQEVLEALSGNGENWNYDYDHTPQGWFYKADDKIRDRQNTEWAKQAKTIDDYIVAAPKYKGDIYRGMSLDQSVIDDLTVGGKFGETGRLSSWTSEKDVAQMFAEGRSEELGKTPVIIKTSNPSYGTPAAHLSMFGSDEQEVLVSNMHDVEYTISEIKKGNGIIEIILKERRR